MRWAVAQGYREDNPAGEAIGAALPKNGVRPQHLAALPYSEVAGALEQVCGSGAYPGTVLAFEFLVLTACRSGEVRGARWEEMDLEAREWRIPPERMKTGREHRVPLSTGALAVLREARDFSDSCGAGVSLGTRRIALQAGDREAGPGSRDRCRAARLPVELPGLGGGVLGRAAGGVRVSAGPCEHERHRGGLSADAICSSGGGRSWSSGPRFSHDATATKRRDPAPILRGQFMAGGGSIVPGDAAAPAHRGAGLLKTTVCPFAGMDLGRGEGRTAPGTQAAGSAMFHRVP